jgi:probable rRNA maturation factor
MIQFHAQYLHWWIRPSEKFLQDLAADFGKIIMEINYLLVKDEEILRINREFLQHDYYTDIISFPYSNGRRIRGDIYVSADRVIDNAVSHSDKDVNRELARVIIHGLLHFCGINDKTEDEEKAMRELENKYLELLFRDSNNYIKAKTPKIQ